MSAFRSIINTTRPRTAKWVVALLILNEIRGALTVGYLVMAWYGV